MDEILRCSNSTGIDFEKVRPCYEGKEGRELFAESISKKDQAKVTKSCTIQINGKTACIRDGGIWYDCPTGSTSSDFVSSICAAYASQNNIIPSVCQNIAP